MPATKVTVRDLRRRWKPHKERLGSHPTAIRFHRACSWLECAEHLDPTDHADLVLVNQWIAWNSLYGQWDELAREPLPDRESWRRFSDRVLALDHDRQVGAVLQEHKPLVLSILEDEYLAGFYWRDPTAHNKQAARYVRKRALGWFVGHDWTLILDQVLERVYLLRCQLIHGAATYGGKLNRVSLRHTSRMLGHLLPAVLLVIIDHGADEDWGPLCYPPHAEGAGNGEMLRPLRPR